MIPNRVAVAASREAAEPLDEYLRDRPAVLLKFLDVAEQYWRAEQAAEPPVERDIKALPGR